MGYYKLTCIRVKDSYYIGVSAYDLKFNMKRYITLSDIKSLTDEVMNRLAEYIREGYKGYLN